MENRKGDSSLMEILVTVLFAVGILFVAFQIPAIINQMFSLFAVASADATARDLGGLISISGAAIESAEIKYAGADENVVYDVDVENKLVKVTALDIDTLEPLSITTSILNGYSKIPFEVHSHVDSARFFSIEKSLNEAEAEYKMGAG